MNSLWGELIPDWLDVELWETFIDGRKKMGKRYAATEGAKKLIFMELDRLRQQGHPPNAVLAQSIRRGYLDVFPIDKRQLTPTIVSGSQPIYRHREVKQTPEAVNQGLEGLKEARRRMMESKIK
jgi:hypothetical protein